MVKSVRFWLSEVLGWDWAAPNQTPKETPSQRWLNRQPPLSGSLPEQDTQEADCTCLSDQPVRAIDRIPAAHSIWCAWRIQQIGEYDPDNLPNRTAYMTPVGLPSLPDTKTGRYQLWRESSSVNPTETRTP